MEISNLIPHIESLIFASDKPLTAPEITELVNQAFGFMEDKVVAGQVDAAIEGIVEKYNSEFYPFEVRQSGGGWQFLTKKEFHKTVAQLNGEKFLKRLSSAALETLAIIAYKQPVTKGEIESIRGVSSDYAVQKLLEKELIVITGRNEKLPGHPLVYTTSKNFMDYFGINSPEDLPKIKEVLANQLVAPTVVNHTDFEQSDVLAVSDSGELIAATDETEANKTETTKEQDSVTAEMKEDTQGTPSVNEGTDQSAELTPGSLEDERVEEDFITDEIFAADKDLAAEDTPEEDSAAGTDMPDDTVLPDSEARNDEEDSPDNKRDLPNDTTT